MIDFFTDQTGGILHKVPEMKKKMKKKTKRKEKQLWQTPPRLGYV